MPWVNPWMMTSTPPEPNHPPPPELLSKGKGKGVQQQPLPATHILVAKAPPPTVLARFLAGSAAEARLTKGGGKGGGVEIIRGGKGGGGEEPVVGTHLGATPVPPGEHPRLGLILEERRRQREGNLPPD